MVKGEGRLVTKWRLTWENSARPEHSARERGVPRLSGYKEIVCGSYTCVCPDIVSQYLRWTNLTFSQYIFALCQVCLMFAPFPPIKTLKEFSLKEICINQNQHFSQALWHMHIIGTGGLVMLRQGNHKCEASKGCKVRPCLTKPNQNCISYFTCYQEKIPDKSN